MFVAGRQTDLLLELTDLGTLSVDDLFLIIFKLYVGELSCRI